MTYEFHELANEFPLMDDGELDNLVEDIRAHGQIVPAYLLGGKVLDGRNRAMACERLGIELQTLNAEDDDLYKDDPASFVASLNIFRRNMSHAARAEVYRALRAQGKSLREIANKVGVSPQAVAKGCQPVDSDTPKVIGKDGKKYPVRKKTVRDSHSETTEESAPDVSIPTLTMPAKDVSKFAEFVKVRLDESTGELTEAETSQAIVDSFVAAMASWSERINKTGLDDAQVERCCEAVSKFVRTVKP